MDRRTEKFTAKFAYTTIYTTLNINLNNPNEIFNTIESNLEIVEGGTKLQENGNAIIDFTNYNFYESNHTKKSFYIRNKNCGECNLCYNYLVLKKCSICNFKICEGCNTHILECPQRCGGNFHNI